MKFRLSFVFFIVFVLFSCHRDVRDVKLSDAQIFKDERFVVNRTKLHQHLIQLCGGSNRFHRNVAMRNYYDKYESFIWIDNSFNLDKADTLLSWLRYVQADGISPKIFHLRKIEGLMNKLKNYDIKRNESLSIMLADLDYLLTIDYLRYVDGMKFGFVNPELIYNNLEELQSISDTIGSSEKKKMLFDLKIYHPNVEFDMAALESVKYGLNGFLIRVQPTSNEYILLKDKLAHVRGMSLQNKIALNMERFRWKMLLNRGSKYLWINLADYTLYGIDHHSGDTISMKVCQGSLEHKTPILSSRITHVEINPYWVLPKSIVRREVIPGMMRDNMYLENRDIKVLDKKGKEVNPHSISWNAQADDIPYTFRQDNGGENSLGRLIFRFKNGFSIFLHDTNSHDAFSNNDRAVSHGCIRLERPLDLVWFLMENKDRARMQQIKNATLKEDVKRPGYYLFNKPIPLFLIYFTVYVDNRGIVRFCSDPYGYDVPLSKALNQL